MPKAGMFHAVSYVSTGPNYVPVHAFLLSVGFGRSVVCAVSTAIAACPPGFWMVAKSSPAKKEKKEKRAPSAYNVFMKSELAKIKKEHPNLDHKEAFTKAAGNWKNSPQNPKNKK